jgi:hypothetical protein
MIKRITAFSLASGKDPEKLWQTWVEHAMALKEVPHLKKYVINRVTKILPNRDGSKPNAEYYGIVEMWFDNEEAQAEADKEMGEITKGLPKDEFGPMTSSPRLAFFVEEKVVK